jgi:hypothetical protein
MNLGLFSSINRLICLNSHNSHQISCILKVFYATIVVYFYVWTKIIDIFVFTLNINMYVYRSYHESQN